MTIRIDQLPVLLSPCFLEWAASKAISKEIEYIVEIPNQIITVQFVFARSYLIWPVKGCPTPSLVKHSINVSTDEPRIRQILKDSLISKNDSYYFPADTAIKHDFELFFFASTGELAKHLAAKKTERERLGAPQSSFCNLL